MHPFAPPTSNSTHTFHTTTGSSVPVLTQPDTRLSRTVVLNLFTPAPNNIWTGDPPICLTPFQDKYCENSRSTGSFHNMWGVLTQRLRTTGLEPEENSGSATGPNEPKYLHLSYSLPLPVPIDCHGKPSPPASWLLTHCTFHSQFTLTTDIYFSWQMMRTRHNSVNFC